MEEKQPGNNPLERDRKTLSILAPLEEEIREKAKEDPFARFLLEGWKYVLFVAVAIFAAVYIKNAYLKNQKANQEYAADRFSQVRNTLLELKALATHPEKTEIVKEGEASKAPSKEEVEKKLSEALKALSEVQRPYGETSALYGSLLALGKGQSVEAPSALPEPSKSLERMIAELQALLSARSKLDNPETSMQAKASLKRLANEGVFVQVSAAISYARVALNPDEKREALTLLSTVQERQPEQAQLVEPELRRLKGLSS